MVIWLSHPRMAHVADTGGETRYGVNEDIVARETFGVLASVDDIYGRAQAERQAILAAAQIEREHLLQAARAEAAALVADAARERAGAAETGYREGMAQGLADWLDQVANVSSDAHRLQRQLSKRMAEIVMLAVEQIVGGQGAQALFTQALGAVDRIVEGSTYLRVSVHPGDLDAARAAFGDLERRWRELGRPVALSVLGDKRLMPGSCTCESDVGIVDAGLSTQLDTLRAAVERALRASVDDAGAASARALPVEESQ
ncbi:MAG TPA: type III secretion system stator protein SctL [Paraburkholderia sp.]|nr:type III secretion system stator protein SctL [Paraburkholderia sp.]